MPQLNAGATVTLTLTERDSVSVSARGSLLVEAVSGLGMAAGRIAEMSGSRIFGPYQAGSLRLTAASQECMYEVSLGVSHDTVSNITYGTSGLADGKVTGYEVGGVAHVVSYPNATTVTDVGGGATCTATLDEDGRITGIVTT